LPARVPREPDNVTNSAKKLQAILEAATVAFLQNGYLGTNMDQVAALAGVSKQTVYNYFSNKETLFIEIVTQMTNAGSDAVRNETDELQAGTDIAEYLRSYAYRQLKIVLTPRLMQLRRVVIGEVSRFPELGKCLYEGGPKRAIRALAKVFSDLAERGLLAIDDAETAASQFNWLIMSEPVNRAMLLGDDSIPTPAALRRHAEEGVRIFLAAYSGR
jgi:TetR/AcrR family transcriptional regulator, mexJK operon transcriptional repressor